MKLAQRAQKGAAAAPPVVAIQGEVLQKDQQAKHVRIARLRHAEFPLLGAPVLGQRALDRKSVV